jgi:hypothetical protein
VFFELDLVCLPKESNQEQRTRTTIINKNKGNNKPSTREPRTKNTLKNTEYKTQTNHIEQMQHQTRLIIRLVFLCLIFI